MGALTKLVFCGLLALLPLSAMAGDFGPRLRADFEAALQGAMQYPPSEDAQCIQYIQDLGTFGEQRLRQREARKGGDELGDVGVEIEGATSVLRAMVASGDCRVRNMQDARRDDYRLRLFYTNTLRDRSRELIQFSVMARQTAKKNGVEADCGKIGDAAYILSMNLKKLLDDIELVEQGEFNDANASTAVWNMILQGGDLLGTAKKFAHSSFTCATIKR